MSHLSSNTTTPILPKTSTVLRVVPTMTTNAPVPSPYSHTQNIHDWEARRPPSVDEAALALADLRIITRSQNTTIRSDDVLRTRLDNLDRFLAIYTTGKGWAKAVDYTASILEWGATCSR